jgi:hypothetical protein
MKFSKILLYLCPNLIIFCFLLKTLIIEDVVLKPITSQPLQQPPPLPPPSVSSTKFNFSCFRPGPFAYKAWTKTIANEATLTHHGPVYKYALELSSARGNCREVCRNLSAMGTTGGVGQQDSDLIDDRVCPGYERRWILDPKACAKPPLMYTCSGGGYRYVHPDIDLRLLENGAACAALARKGIKKIVTGGDSFMRHMYQGLLMVLSGNFENGGVNVGVSSCDDDRQFDEKECRGQVPTVSRACGGNVTTVLYWGSWWMPEMAQLHMALTPWSCRAVITPRTVTTLGTLVTTRNTSSRILSICARVKTPCENLCQE